MGFCLELEVVKPLAAHARRPRAGMGHPAANANSATLNSMRVTPGSGATSCPQPPCKGGP